MLEEASLPPWPEPYSSDGAGPVGHNVGGVDCRPIREAMVTAPGAAQSPTVTHDHSDDVTSPERSYHDTDDILDPEAEIAQVAPSPVEEQRTPASATRSRRRF
jgi:hypothetical protein